jgi:ribosomal protein L18
MSLSNLKEDRIRFRIRKSISGTATTKVVSVFSNKEIYAQLIDDVNGVTIPWLLQEKRNRKRY